MSCPPRRADTTGVTRSTRAPVRAATLAAGVAAAVALAGPTASAGGTGGAYTSDCPRPESLVAGTSWHTHRLAPGAVLREGNRTDGRGQVRMHVLSVDLTSRHLTVRPLIRKIAMRSRLTSLARGRAGLLAATNTGFFDFGNGAPMGPLVSAGHALTAARAATSVVGFNRAGTAQAGHLALSGTVTTAGESRRLAGLNLAAPAAGITAYTSAWGTAPVSLPGDSVGRYVKAGVVTTAAGRSSAAPSSGYLLVARGTAAVDWLTAVPRGASVAVTRTVMTDAAHPFAQAYSVSTQLVLPGGHTRTDLTCRKRYPQPARTAVGFTAGGKRLLLAVVEDHPGTKVHGLDSVQMSRLMGDLGADQAYLFDGSGSSELLARVPGAHRLSLRTYPADGAERTMPLGLGIFRRH